MNDRSPPEMYRLIYSIAGGVNVTSNRLVKQALLVLAYARGLNPLPADTTSRRHKLVTSKRIRKLLISCDELERIIKEMENST